MNFCKSGKHCWTDKSDAEKCCNGWTRILVISPPDKLNDCSNIQYEESTGVLYGRKWVKDDSNSAVGSG